MVRNKLRYLVLLLAVGLLSILYNTYYMGIIFLTLVIFPFLLFAILSFIFGFLKAELISAAHVVNKGDAIPISIMVNNPTIFPISSMKIYLTYKNAYSGQRYDKEFVISLDGRTKSSIICSLYSEFAGNMEINLKGIRLYDYLKIFSLKKKLKGELKAAVLPLYYELTQEGNYNRRTRLIESDTYSPYKSGDDPSEVFAIREYREGDRLQRIHWKLSRKLDQLMIKEFSDPMNCSILLFVNLCVPEEANTLYFIDAILECALSFSYTLLTKGQQHYFSWYDERHGLSRRIRVTQEKDLFEAVDGLLQALPYSKSTDAMSSYLAEHPNDQYTDLIFVTGDTALMQLDMLTAIKAQSRQLIYVSDVDNLMGIRPISPELKSKSAEIGVELWPVDATNVRRDLETVQIV